VKLVESTALTDTGRKRRHNEDSHVYDPPLFVVADGMGGAQAGEVASGLVVAAFRDFHAADHLSGVERLAVVIREANRRIFERATNDAEASGMGTTVTAALVEGDRIAVGHVGDSRAYLVRDGKLEQLTQDHSLVADLVRSGRLTPEEADTHPQRSVITRALGTDADVEVDTFTFEAYANDLRPSTIAYASVTVPLAAGAGQTITVDLPGWAFPPNGFNGPYLISMNLYGSSGGWDSDIHTTAAYLATDFEPAATFAPPHSDTGVDRDSPPDGQYNLLRVNVSLNVNDTGW